MNCNDIKNLLPDYAADETRGEVKRSITRHLKSCDECRKEYESLRAYFFLTSSLEQQKAPDNFLAGLHAVIHETESKEKRSFKHLLTLLFLPLKIKIPLEAAGVLAVSLIIVFFFMPFQFHQQETYRVPEKEKDLAEEFTNTESLHPGKPEVSAPAEKQKDGPVAVKKHSRSIRMKALPAPPVVYELALQIPAEKTPSISERESSDNLSGGTVNRMEKKKESHDVQAPSKSLKSAPADEIFAKNTDDSPDRPYPGNIAPVRNLISILDGTILEEGDETSAKGRHYIIFTLPARNYLNMVYQLKTIGLVSDRKKALPPDEGTIKIRLVVNIKK